MHYLTHAGTTSGQPATVSSSRGGWRIKSGWRILPYQAVAMYLRQNDWEIILNLGGLFKVNALKAKMSNFVALEDKATAIAGAIDQVTTPTNQPYFFVYKDTHGMLPPDQVGPINDDGKDNIPKNRQEATLQEYGFDITDCLDSKTTLHEAAETPTVESDIDQGAWSETEHYKLHEEDFNLFNTDQWTLHHAGTQPIEQIWTGGTPYMYVNYDATTSLPGVDVNPTPFGLLGRFGKAKRSAFSANQTDQVWAGGNTPASADPSQLDMRTNYDGALKGPQRAYTSKGTWDTVQCSFTSSRDYDESPAVNTDKSGLRDSDTANQMGSYDGKMLATGHPVNIPMPGILMKTMPFLKVNNEVHQYCFSFMTTYEAQITCKRANLRYYAPRHVAEHNKILTAGNRHTTHVGYNNYGVMGRPSNRQAFN